MMQEKVDYLDVDIIWTNYVCLSFETPEALIKKKHSMYLSSYSLIVKNRTRIQRHTPKYEDLHKFSDC